MRTLSRAGFTLVEMVVVVTIIGVTAMYALPKITGAARHESVRSARREVTTQLARAKATAVQRSCRSSLQIRQSTNEVWVESCKITGAGRDTVGSITKFTTKYKVAMTTTGDSVPFGPTSLGLAPAAITMTFGRAGYTLSLAISAVGESDMVKNRSGMTLVEVMIAVLMLTVGILAFVSTSIATVRMLSRGNRSVKAAFYSQRRIETLASTPCQLLASGSQTTQGVFQQVWTVTDAPGGNSKRVRVISTYPAVLKRTRSDTSEISVLCIR